MSGARRLQTEIDRTLKKVEEGVEIFDEVWEKVYAAQQQNLKEKYEVDLKKEIKKLQRFRDQIKAWISSSEVKEKGDLTEARKLIESKMELFKVCEKETKTKAYSKEGLAKADRLDPEEQAKEESRQFLGGNVEKLSLQIEALEADVEKLAGGKKKKNQDEITRKQGVIIRHRWHIAKLEQMVRMIDNDALEADQVEEVKDDIEYYVESGVDTEGMDELDPYETLDMEDIPMVMEPALVVVEDSSSKKKKGDKDAAKDDKKSKDKKGATSLLTIGRATKQKEKDKDKEKKEAAEKAAEEEKQKAAAATQANQPVLAQPQPSSPQKAAGQSLKATSASPSPKPPQIGGTSLASILKGSDAPPPAPPSASSKQQMMQQQQQQLLAQQQQQQKQQASLEQQRLQQHASQQRLQQQLQAASQQKVLEQQRMMQSSSNQSQNGQLPPSPSLSGFSGLMAGLGSAPTTTSSVPTSMLSDAHTMALPMKADKSSQNNSSAVVGGDSKSSNSSGTSSVVGDSSATVGSNLTHQSGPSAGGSGGGPAGLVAGGAGTTANEDPIYRSLNMDPAAMGNALAQLSGSMSNMPSSHDRDRAKQYIPRNPYQTPPAYFNAPGPSPVFDEAVIFEKFHTDTLFFIFYYQQGTYQQYLAAKELKKQSWRFHKKYKTWFQRHEEPQVTTDEYEQGTYVYFDYQGTYDSKSGWCQRIKYDFTFEYEFLEDEL